MVSSRSRQACGAGVFAPWAQAPRLRARPRGPGKSSFALKSRTPLPEPRFKDRLCGATGGGELSAELLIAAPSSDLHRLRLLNFLNYARTPSSLQTLVSWLQDSAPQAFPQSPPPTPENTAPVDNTSTDLRPPQLAQLLPPPGPSRRNNAGPSCIAWLKSEQARDSHPQGLLAPMAADLVIPDPANKQAWWQRLSAQRNHCQDSPFSTAQAIEIMHYFHSDDTPELTQFMTDDFFARLPHFTHQIKDLTYCTSWVHELLPRNYQAPFRSQLCVTFIS